MKKNNDFSVFRNFDLKPTKIGKDQLKKTINLTLTCILKENKKIRKSVINEQETIKQLFKKNKITTSNKLGENIYIYPQDTIHFSLISFIEQNLNTNFITAKEEFQNKYNAIIKLVDQQIKQCINDHNSNNNLIEFRWIYTGKEQDVPKTIALQAYLNEDFINLLNEIKNQCQNILNEKLVQSTIKIKAFPNNCAINLFRFFDFMDNEKEKIKNIIEQININHDKLPIDLQDDITCSLVISDSYLSNIDPIIKDQKENKLNYQINK